MDALQLKVLGKVTTNGSSYQYICRGYNWKQKVQRGHALVGSSGKTLRHRGTRGLQAMQSDCLFKSALQNHIIM